MPIGLIFYDLDLIISNNACKKLIKSDTNVTAEYSNITAEYTEVTTEYTIDNAEYTNVTTEYAILTTRVSN